MSKTFTAGPQSLGFIYQIFRYSLYLSLKHRADSEVALYIERFDDLEICRGENTEQSLQIKQVSTNLTNRSKDLWKTLRVWSENCLSGTVHLPGAILTLATTATAPTGSIASLLRDDINRNPQDALTKLLQESRKTTTSLEEEIKAFDKLSTEQQRHLVNAIWILDQSPTITDIPERVKALCVGVQPFNRDELYMQLEGWWINLVVDHLQAGSRAPILVSTVLKKIADINDGLKARQLEDPFFDLPLPDDYDWDSRTFIRQLRLIDINPHLVLRAQEDYFRARKLRDYLVDELCLTQLTAYDRNLIESWELRFYEIVDEECKKTNDEAKLRQLGRGICNSVLKEVQIPIHQQLPDSTNYATRGSYHILADDEKNLSVGWHPLYRERLKYKE